MASLWVYMNGQEVGEYIQNKNGSQEFIYSDPWLENNRLSIPLSLSLPLTEKKHKGDIVYNYFENLLPDSKEIRQRIQAKFSAQTDRPFDLLSVIGKDCIGAIQLMTEKTNIDVKKIQAQSLSETEIANILKSYTTLPLGMDENDDFRISLAGAQEKIALLWNEENWQRPIGSTPTTHIFKLPIGKIEQSNIDLTDSIENEWLCLEILREFGLSVPNLSIKSFEDKKVLVVERFDRQRSKDASWIIRQPQEDMCQATGYSAGLKYESDGGPSIEMIMNVLKSSTYAEKDRKDFMLRVFLYWLLGAIDGHAKNYSIFLKPGGRFQLTPVYDVISAYPLIDKKQLSLREIKMAMALRGKNKHYHWYEIMPRHWFSESKLIDFPKEEMEFIIEETLVNIDDVISKVETRLPKHFPAQIYESIFSRIKYAAKRF